MIRPRTCISLALLGAVFTACNFSTPGAKTTYPVGCSTSDLINAITHANADSGPAEIVLAADCEYKFFGAADTQSIDGVSIRSALPPITSEIEFVGNNAVLSSSISTGSNAAFGFFLVQLDGTLSAENLTMKNGTRPRGGAVFIDHARAHFFNVVFYANLALGISPAAPGKGGAIYNRGGALSVTGDSLFSLNAAANDILEPHPDSAGGGIFNADGSLIVNRSTFDGNAAELGGAIAIQESAEAQGGIGVIISGSTFLDNNADEGGAIWAEGEKTLFSISGSDFTENSASSRAGAIQIRDSILDLVASSFTGNTAGACGAVENAQGSDLTVSHTDFTGNSTTGSGGGLCHTGRTMEVNGSLFQSNQATTGWGGGIYIEAPVTDIKKSTFSENTAYKGGGLYAGNLPGAENALFIVVNIRQSTFYANQATGGVIEENPWNPAGGGIGFGGKILIIDQSTIWLNRSEKGAGVYALRGDVSIMNSTISMNAGYRGAGLYLEASTSLTMDFTSLIDNSANQSSGSIDLSGTAVIRNSIARDSFADGGKACKFNGAGPFDVSNINLAYDDSCGFSLTSIYMNVAPLADNGGPTYTHALETHHSPAYDAGDCHGVMVDQRGEARPKGAACDLGSFELDYVPNPPLPPDSPTPSSTPSRCEYRAIENANCRAGDDARTKVVKILMKGDPVDLLSLNPELTHGLFALPDGRSCWVWMPFMEGPADPRNNCNATIVDPEPYAPEGPACSSDLPKAQCEAAGGTMSGASSSASECICPSAASFTDPSTGPQSVACAGTGDRPKDPSAGLASLTRKFSILWPI